LKAPELNRKNMLPVATPQPTAEPIYVSGAQPPRPLTKMQLNDSGENVWWLQQKLTELGYYHGKCSGTFLAGTQEAVRAFQKDAGLRVNGTADVQTLEKLYEKELATPVPTATPEPVPTDIPMPEETAAIETLVPTATPAPMSISVEVNP
ncbi:MAG: peptidoglycan-binding protein, partial [Clostridia bacterium]|nr:peptidoglycan-binding protein [Clostridia bacterium]